MNGVLHKRSISNKKQKEKNIMWKKLKKYLPNIVLYIVIALVIFVVVVLVLYRSVILNIIKCPSNTLNVYVSELDTYLGIVSGGIAIFSLWALVMTVFSITKLGNISKTSDKVKKINKSMLWQHMLQLNYAGRHRSETILQCRQVLHEGGKINKEVRLYVMDMLIKTYIEVYSDLREKQLTIPEEDKRYKEFLRNIIHDEMRKVLEACQKFRRKQENLTVKNLQADIYFEKGCFEGLCGDYENSITDIKMAINLNDRSPNYYSNLAVSQCLTQKDDYVEDAVKNLKKALKLSNDQLYNAWFYNKANILDVFDDRQWEKIGEKIKKELVEKVCDGMDYRSKKVMENKSKIQFTFSME